MFTRNRRAAVWIPWALFTSAAVVVDALLPLGRGWKAGLLLALSAAIAVTVGIVGHRFSYAGPPMPLIEIADRLSKTSYTRWKSEAHTTLGAGNPYEIKVEWVANSSPLPVSEPAGLYTGIMDDLADSFTIEPKNRVVLLGAPGSGKSILTLRLVLNLLNKRKSGDPVPVLVWLASWNPKETDLREWIVRILECDYPYLSAQVTSNGRTESEARTLLATGLVLPILDGLDEIPNIARDLAIKKINDAFPPGGGLVITCRTDDYAASARTGSRVAEATVIQLRPVNPRDALSYLSRGNLDPRWELIKPTLLREPTAPLSCVLTMPLMITLANEIYNGNSLQRHDQHSYLPAPKDLLIFETADDIETLLFDAYLPSVFESHRPPDWKNFDRAERWLGFIAAYMEKK